VKAFLAQDNTASVGRGIEKAADQDTTISIYTAVFFDPDLMLVSKSVVIDEETGEQFEVIGKPAKRAGLATGTAFVAAQLRLISDLQGA
jgi:hypothetical protein